MASTWIQKKKQGAFSFDGWGKEKWRIFILYLGSKMDAIAINKSHSLLYLSNFSFILLVMTQLKTFPFCDLLFGIIFIFHISLRNRLEVGKTLKNNNISYYTNNIKNLTNFPYIFLVETSIVIGLSILKSWKCLLRLSCGN